MIVGTAGHIDHGKSALVTALTGRPMDRLAEERRRGITIDLNFAPLELDGLPPVGIVDVPGHEDFVRTMVAGASGIDLVLLVVDSVEGMRPQTVEHLAVVEQLGIPRGIPVLTKADLVEAEWLELVRAELTERLARSPVVFDDPIVTSAVTGQGLDHLRSRLGDHARAAAARPAGDLFRLPVDRVFAVAGIGTVVTGTVWSGGVGVGGAVVCEPGSRPARVRSIEAYGKAVDRATPGSRTALGLTGVNRADLARGMVVLDAAAAWRATLAFDAVVRLLADAPGPLRGRDRVRIHHGTAEVMGRLHHRIPIEPGGEGLARVILEAPVLLRGGDRFVLRRFSPVTTIGGGTVLDPFPPRRSPSPTSPHAPSALASSDPAERLEALLARRAHGLAAAELAIALGLPPAQATAVAERRAGVRAVGDRWLAAGRLATAREQILQRVDHHHAAEPSSPGLSLETLRRSLGPAAWLADSVLQDLAAAGLLRVGDGVALRAGFVPRAGGGAAEVRRVVEAIRGAGLEPPTTAELSERLALRDFPGALRIALQQHDVEAVERDRCYAREALDRVRAAVTALERNAEVVPAALREELGVSRKFLIPLLEWCDRQGLTRRTPDGKRLRC